TQFPIVELMLGPIDQLLRRPATTVMCASVQIHELEIVTRMRAETSAPLSALIFGLIADRGLVRRSDPCRSGRRLARVGPGKERAPAGCRFSIPLGLRDQTDTRHHEGETDEHHDPQRFS